MSEKLNERDAASKAEMEMKQYPAMPPLMPEGTEDEMIEDGQEIKITVSKRIYFTAGSLLDENLPAADINSRNLRWL